jgi:hypothetical protein
MQSRGHSCIFVLWPSTPCTVAKAVKISLLGKEFYNITFLRLQNQLAASAAYRQHIKKVEAVVDKRARRPLGPSESRHCPSLEQLGC